MDKGVAWPSYKTIARECGIAERTAMRAIKALVNLGELTRTERRDEEGSHTSNLYTLPKFDAWWPSVTKSQRPSQKHHPTQNTAPPPAQQSQKGRAVESHESYNESFKLESISESNPMQPSAADLGPPHIMFDSLVQEKNWPRFTSAWEAYVEMRKNKRAKVTPSIAALVHSKLWTLAQKGHNPIEVLEQSTRSNWTDVYPIKEERQHESHHERRSRKTFEAIAAAGVDAMSADPPRQVQRALPSTDKQGRR